LVDPKCGAKWWEYVTAIQTQKGKVQELLELGEISYTTAGQLRKNIGLEEAALFEEDVS